MCFFVIVNLTLDWLTACSYHFTGCTVSGNRAYEYSIAVQRPTSNDWTALYQLTTLSDEQVAQLEYIDRGTSHKIEKQKQLTDAKE